MCLKYGPVVYFQEIVTQQDGSTVVKVKVVSDVKEKLKGFVHWVAKDYSVDAVIRLYNYMFDTPQVTNDDWEQHINKDSLIEKPNGKVWQSLEHAKEYDRFQFERLAYFVVDRDSRTAKTGGKLVFNRIVELKESKEKNKKYTK